MFGWFRKKTKTPDGDDVGNGAEDAKDADPSDGDGDKMSEGYPDSEDRSDSDGEPSDERKKNDGDNRDGGGEKRTEDQTCKFSKLEFQGWKVWSSLPSKCIRRTPAIFNAVTTIMRGQTAAQLGASFTVGRGAKSGKSGGGGGIWRLKRSKSVDWDWSAADPEWTYVRLEF